MEPKVRHYYSHGVTQLTAVKVQKKFKNRISSASFNFYLFSSFEQCLASLPLSSSPALARKKTQSQNLSLSKHRAPPNTRQNTRLPLNGNKNARQSHFSSAYSLLCKLLSAAETSWLNVVYITQLDILDSLLNKNANCLCQFPVIVPKVFVTVEQQKIIKKQSQLVVWQ